MKEAGGVWRTGGMTVFIMTDGRGVGIGIARRSGQGKKRIGKRRTMTREKDVNPPCRIGPEDFA